METPKVGDRQLWNGALYEVTQVQPNYTPYGRANQTTKLEGYTVGLQKVEQPRKPAG